MRKKQQQPENSQKNSSLEQAAIKATEDLKQTIKKARANMKKPIEDETPEKSKIETCEERETLKEVTQTLDKIMKESREKKSAKEQSTDPLYLWKESDTKINHGDDVFKSIENSRNTTIVKDAGQLSSEIFSRFHNNLLSGFKFNLHIFTTKDTDVIGKHAKTLTTHSRDFIKYLKKEMARVRIPIPSKGGKINRPAMINIIEHKLCFNDSANMIRYILNTLQNIGTDENTYDGVLIDQPLNPILSCCYWNANPFERDVYRGGILDTVFDYYGDFDEIVPTGYKDFWSRDLDNHLRNNKACIEEMQITDIEALIKCHLPLVHDIDNFGQEAKTYAMTEDFVNFKSSGDPTVEFFYRFEYLPSIAQSILAYLWEFVPNMKEQNILILNTSENVGVPLHNFLLRRCSGEISLLRSSYYNNIDTKFNNKDLRKRIKDSDVIILESKKLHPLYEDNSYPKDIDPDQYRKEVWEAFEGKHVVELGHEYNPELLKIKLSSINNLTGTLGALTIRNIVETYLKRALIYFTAHHGFNE